MDLIKELSERGIIAQSTNLEGVRELLNTKKITFYTGFDPTADSLHIGHFIQFKNMRYLQQAGHTPIAIFGGGTAMIGDPSGRSDMRKMLTKEDINNNIENFKKQAARYLDTSEGKAKFINNADWLCEIKYMDMLREIGVHFSVNKMLTAECFKSRLEKGLSFLEFNYMIMQGYDFYRLYKDHGCIMQLAGDDQWSNMLAGVDLIRRKETVEAYALTTALLVGADGVKMGKSMKNALWIDPDKTSPYDFYQFFRNVDDAVVTNYMRVVTFMPMEEIREFESYTDSRINIAKEKLAYEVTKAVHNEDEAKKALTAAKTLFSAGSGNDSNMPTTKLEVENFTDGKITIIDLLVAGKLAPSKGEAKRLVEQGGIYIGENKIDSFNYTVEKSTLEKESIIVKKGKKIFHKFTV